MTAGPTVHRFTVTHYQDGDRSRQTVSEFHNSILQPDMPVFVLKAKDVCAPAAIRAWALEAARAGAAPGKVGDALLDAVTFENFQRRYGTKVPD